MKRVADNQPPCATAPESPAQFGSLESRVRAFGEWPVPTALQEAIEHAVRNAIETGLSFAETYQRVAAQLAASGCHFTPDDLRRWIRAHALSLT